MTNHMVDVYGLHENWAGPDRPGKLPARGNCLHKAITSEAGLLVLACLGPLRCHLQYVYGNHLQVALCTKPLPDLDSLVSQLALSRQLVKEISPKRLTVSLAPLCSTAHVSQFLHSRSSLASPEHLRTIGPSIPSVASRAPSQNILLLPAADGTCFDASAGCLRDLITASVRLCQAWPALVSTT